MIPEDKRRKGPVGLPRVDGAMNKTVPKSVAGGKGSKEDKEALALGTEKPKQSDEKILQRARKRMDMAIAAESDNRKEALEDRKMKAGDQWPADIMADRMQDRRPCITINKLKTFVHQITNDQRQNRPSIHVSPIGDKGDPEAAKMFAGMIRFIERESHAEDAYDTAFDDAVTSGFGYFRLLTEFESPDTFDQVLKVMRIRNPFTVYLDTQHQEPDGSDSKWGFISEMIPRSEFTDRWPDADPCPWDKAGIGETLKNWMTQDELRVAEYFEIEFKKKRLVALDNGFTGLYDECSDEVKADIKSGKIEIVREREADHPKCMWYRLTAVEVLEEKEWVGQWLPIFKVIGDEIDVEGKVKLSGIVRDAKSPQQMYNYWSTLLTEMIALVPKSPYLGAEGQFEGHEAKWLQANNKSFPYLEYKPTDLEGKPVPPPQRQPVQGVPAGIQQALQNAAQDMMAVTGIRFDSTLSERMHDESGAALDALAQRGDLTNFHYIDNLSRTLRHLGRCLIDAIPKVYDTKRAMTILREDGKEEKVMLDPKAIPNQTTKDSKGKTLSIFNPNIGKFGVTTTIGKSFATKRIEASSRMIEFAKAMPQFGEAFADLIAKNQDWPGSTELTARLAKLVAIKFPGIMTPDMKDVPPEVQAMLGSLDQQLKAKTMELMQAMKALNDQDKDRAIDMEKINKDFEAKMTKIIADIETKTAATTEKATANLITHSHAVAELGVKVATLMHQIENPEKPGDKKK